MLPEGAYDLAGPTDAPIGLVVLHPHPDMGGDRWNPVVGAVWQAAVAAGWAVVRFDFSSSDPAVAGAEASDALDLLPPTPTTALLGYSFGATVAARVVDDRIDRWALVAPPFGPHVAAAALPAGGDPRPKLLLVPAQDQFCPPDRAEAETETWAATTIEVVAGADHFLGAATAATAARAITWLTTGVVSSGR